jgi:hypothetical protein
MELKQLNRAIDALGKKNANVESEIQALGLACLAHCEQHGDTMPMNRLVNVLRRGQYQAFIEWAMSFGRFIKNTDKATKDSQPLAYAKGKTTDMQAATDKPWFEFADSKATATAKAFDFQAATMALLKKAASNGVDHDTLIKVATLAGIAPEKVPATVTKPSEAAEPALM